MKLVYKFRFFADEFYKIKNAPRHLLDRSSNKWTAVIKIPRDHPEFDNVLNWAKEHKKIIITSMVFVEKIFSESELNSAEILYLSWIDDAPGEMYANEYGTKYEVIKKCKQFEIYKQISPLFCNTSKLSKKKDIQRLFSSEIIISKRLKEIFEREKITGVQIRPVYRPLRIKNIGDAEEILNDKTKQSEDWFHLEVVADANHIVVPPTKYGLRYIDFDKSWRNFYLPECNLISDIDYRSYLYLKRKHWPKTDIARTKEMIMAKYPYPLVIINQRTYQILKKNKVKDFKAEPAYFV